MSVELEEVVHLAKNYCELSGYGVGGNLHIVLDDENPDNGSLNWYAAAKGDVKGVQLALKLLCMSISERRKVYRRLHLE